MSALHQGENFLSGAEALHCAQRLVSVPGGQRTGQIEECPSNRVLVLLCTRATEDGAPCADRAVVVTKVLSIAGKSYP